MVAGCNEDTDANQVAIDEAVAATIAAQSKETPLPVENDPISRPTAIATETTASTPTSQATYTPQPTATPESVSLADIDFSPILIVTGDLPANTVPGQVRNGASSLPVTIPTGIASVEQDLANLELERNGLVALLVYDNASEIEAAYKAISKYIEDTVYFLDDMEVGAVSVSGPVSGGLDSSITIRYLAFRRCGTIVWIKMYDVNPIQIAGYAQHLDDRLSSLFCGS